MNRTAYTVAGVVGGAVVALLAAQAYRVASKPQRLADAPLLTYSGPEMPGDRLPASCVAGERVAVLLIMGQSNAANTLSVLAVAGPDVANFSVYDGRCYEAKDPLLGASNDGGNFATILGNMLIERRRFDRVILAPIAVGGTLIHQWAPMGDHNKRIRLAIDRLRKAGLEPTHVLWHQGEGNRDSDPDTYKRTFHGMLSTLRRYGVKAPIYVAQTTICGGPTGEPIRQAQRELVDGTGILAGPDTDQLGMAFRYDRCHFDGEGGRRVAELWFNAIK